jgi:hypothetical protein
MFPFGGKAQHPYAKMIEMRLIFGQACENKRDACPLYQEFFFTYRRIADRKIYFPLLMDGLRQMQPRDSGQSRAVSMP